MTIKHIHLKTKCFKYREYIPMKMVNFRVQIKTLVKDIQEKTLS